MTRRVIYLTGTRADFGLMRSTLLRIAGTPGLALQVLVTGMHLSQAHGMTVREIRESGLPVCAEVPLDMHTRTGESMAQGIAACLHGVTDALAREKPDVLVLLGDRGEMLAGAIAALHLGIPAVHIHGGERSGSVDEPVRHAITKLSCYHLVATGDASRRLAAMGEEPQRIHVTGAPGLDGLAELGGMARAECLAALGLAPDARFILASFHPVVQQAADSLAQARALRQALQQAALPVVWVEPNADAGAHGVLQALDESPLPAGWCRIAHLPRPLFVAALRHAELLVGNSSAGIIEASTFGTPVVNVGDRQRLRERSTNVVDVAPTTAALQAGVGRALGLRHTPCDNPYGDGKAGERIAALLSSLPLGPAVLEKINTY